MTQLPLKLLLSILLFLTSSIIHAATLISSVDRNPIKINQTLTLNVKFDEQANTSDLDLSGIEKDFEILSTIPNSSNSVSIINGQTTRTSSTTWRITLAPKREGELIIPALSLNGVNSAPISVQVANLSAAELAQPQPIEVTLTIDDTDNLSIKPGEQVIVNVELSAAANVGNLRGEELVISGVEIEPLGQQNGQRTENGVARQVVIWRYALFPTAAGQIEIPAQTFSGSIGGRSSFFDSFISGGQQVGGRSVAQTINVEVQPDTNGNIWFPANSVSIESSWSGDTNQLRVGEPITRTITITATGQRAVAIPPLNNNPQAGYKSYQDQPQLENTTSAQGIIGSRIESQAIVPSISGDLNLAEQRVSWWDNRSEQWREAVLPSQTLTVLPSVNGVNSVQNAPDFNANPTISSAQSNQLTSLNNNNFWWQLATSCLVLICLIQFYFLSKRTQIKIAQEHDSNQSSLSESITWKQLNQSLKSGNASNIRKQLLIWARAAMPNQKIVNLDAISKLTNLGELKSQLIQLDKHIYSNGEAINIEQLTAQINLLREEFQLANKKKKTTAGVLAPLYPS